MTYEAPTRICTVLQEKESGANRFIMSWLRGKDLNLRPLGYEPKLTLPLGALRCPGFPKSSDFIALDCPQFGNNIGDGCPALPFVPQRIGDRIGDAVCGPFRPVFMQASQHDGFIFPSRMSRESIGILCPFSHGCLCARGSVRPASGRYVSISRRDSP